MARNKAAPKPPTQAELEAQAEVEEQDLERVVIRESVPERVATLARPLHTVLIAGPRATEANKSYNGFVLDLIVWGLRRVRLVPDIMSLVYAEMANAIASQVGAIASLENAGEEVAAERRDSAATKMHDAGGPFWRISHIIENDGAVGVKSLREQAEDKKASLGRLSTYTDGRIDELAFALSRGAIQCHYTLRSGVEVPFKVKAATDTRNEYTKAQSVVAKLKKNNSQEWGAVRRQYRKEHPAGMPDGRTKKEQDSDTVRAARIGWGRMSSEEQDEVMTREPVEVLTEV